MHTFASNQTFLYCTANWASVFTDSLIALLPWMHGRNRYTYMNWNPITQQVLTGTPTVILERAGLFYEFIRMSAWWYALCCERQQWNICIMHSKLTWWSVITTVSWTNEIYWPCQLVAPIFVLRPYVMLYRPVGMYNWHAAYTLGQAIVRLERQQPLPTRQSVPGWLFAAPSSTGWLVLPAPVEAGWP